MKLPTIRFAAALAVVGGWNASALRQGAPETIDAHLIGSRTAAGFDFTGTLARLRVAPVGSCTPTRNYC
jgi:hypothetical protein